MQIYTGKMYENTNRGMQNLLHSSKELNVKVESPTFFDAPAAEVSFSKEGMSALREQQNQSGYVGYMESRELTEESRYWIDNEIELEHYFSMREMSGQTLKDGNYDVKDLMESMMETYETMYNQILEAHKDGNRQFISEKTGTRSITLEEDLAALDKAYQWRLSNLEGYITCQQTNKQFENPGDISWYLEKIGWRRNKDNSLSDKDSVQDGYNYLDQDYIDIVISMMQEAKETFLQMFQESDYKKGLGKSIIQNIMHNNDIFMEKTQRLFSKEINNQALSR